MIKKIIQDEKSGGILLGISVIIALILANSFWAEGYFHFFEQKIGYGFLELSLHHWINDGLMAIFFFVVGLELKQEMVSGELSNLRKALLPIAAAIGGMFVPACIYLIFNSGESVRSGWGIPMATDIAFALGVLYLLGSKIPVSLKVFLTALAIVDDLGAVLVIAFFYTSDISLLHLGFGLTVALLMYIIGKKGLRNVFLFFVLGFVVWAMFLLSGVHATIAAVLAAFMLPSDILKKLEHRIKPFVTFLILPIFALANAGVSLAIDSAQLWSTNVAVGVGLGLFVGKVLGIMSFTLLFVKLKIAEFPNGMNMRNLLGLGLLAAIGFTMSLFVTSLAFTDEVYITQAKIGIFMASLLGGILGYRVLKEAR